MISSRISSSSHSKSDGFAGFAFAAAAVLSAVVVVLITFFLIVEAAPVLRDVGLTRFLTDNGWYPTEQSYGLWPMLLGTLFASVGAIVLAAPLGIAAALYCGFYASPTLARALRDLFALLAAIPSVVYGLWGLTVLVPFIASLRPPGASLLAGMVVLAMMILPTVALTADAALKSVPRSLLQGAAALGMSREGALIGVILPAARGGIFAGVLLATARAIGETMAVLMVAGNVVAIPESLFDPIRTLTANIALEMAYAMDLHRSALFVSGLMLIGLASLLAVGAWRAGKGAIHG